MDPNPFNNWAVLRIHVGPSALWIGYEDDKGTHRNPPRNLTGESADWIPVMPPPHLLLAGSPLEWMRKRIMAPKDLRRLIDEAISSLPAMRVGPHANGPVPLPIFLDLPRGRSLADWKVILKELLSIDEDVVEFVRLPRRRWSSRPPFSLPLKVLAVGRESGAALEYMQSASWYTDDEEARSHGLQIQIIEPEEISTALRDEARDIVVTDESSVVRVLGFARKLANPLTSRPRLIVVLANEMAKAQLEALAVPSGVSLLCVTGMYGNQNGDYGFLTSFLYGIIHDYPLHEALRAAVREGMECAGIGYGGGTPVLIADPNSNQDLRISDALSQIRYEGLALRQSVGRGDLDGFFERMGDDASVELRDALNSAYELRTPIKEALDLTRNLSVDFGRETWGLVPLARASASIERARAARSEIRTAVASVSSDSKSRDALEKHQDRRVDATLEEEDESFIYRHHEAKTKLVMGARYRLRVHIGRRSDDSLMEGEIPPVDPLLPLPKTKRGHMLDVVVFEKDFVLTSRRVQPLHLPPLQGSEPVYFNLVAPHQETAELRIGVYHQNQLLQSFVLEAQLGAERYLWKSEDQVKIRLSFSRTARFSNLNHLAPRMLSIGVNESTTGGTHSFLFKRGGQAYSLNLAQPILAENTKAFRKILLEAVFDANGDPRFPTYPAAGAAPSAEFEDVIRTLADFGRDLYRATFIRGGLKDRDLKDQLRAVGSKEDQTIQVARLDPNFVFPWTVLYDYGLPQKISGAPPAPVCLGRSAGAAGGDPLVKQCSHGPDDKVYCIYGFWGVRHRVEQHIGEKVSRDAVTKIQPNPQAGICLAVGENDAHTDQMATDLHVSLGAAVAELGTNVDLLDLLWQPQSRPALLIALGHLETGEIQGEPKGPRIVLMAKKKWLQADPITDRQIADGDWDSPRTLVLLMACGSGATDITTLNDLVMALDSVGAAAVVGTECSVFSRLVARFAKEVTADLWSGTVPLGDAIKMFNRRLLASGNPLPFVFSYVGDADLTIAPN